MKIRNQICIGLAAAFSLLLFSCEDLEMSPESNITPEKYLWDESQLAAYTIKRYDKLPASSESALFGMDNNTDVQAGMGVPNSYVTGQYKVGLSGGGWEFEEIYHINYFLNIVLPRYAEKTLTGNEEMIRHYIGEMYFFRAFQYYGKLTAYGDFPIQTTILPDDKAVLTEASKRMPRCEVARFILADLDTAIVMMKKESPDGNQNRLSKPVAQLLKSRVALFEATWLKYFKNTPFVPNGPGWPGADKDYNKGYAFKAGSIDDEINWFLDQAIASADEVASSFPLTSNSGILPQGIGESNPFVEMYADVDLSKYKEILLWKAHNKGMGISQNIQVNSSTSNVGLGITRGMVNSFLMANGLPWYAQGSGYKGDDNIGQVRDGRDQRANLFLKEPNQLNMWINTDMGTHGAIKEPFLPNITSGSAQFRYNTGYTLRKGVNPDKAMCDNWGGWGGILVFRSAEAYLNYMEAYYERHKSLDSKAMAYWKALRTRAGMSEDVQKTIDATDMNIESQFNWSAYSGGQLVDKTLYNIRRERACEFLGEGYREVDLRRWRSMDQMLTKSFHIEGFKVWGDYYKAQYTEAAKTDKTYDLIYGVDNKDANVSSPERSQYLRPYEITRTLAYDGYVWHMAHYLSPIAIQHFKITATDAEGYTDSPIYQNPYWPLKADYPAIK